jgi:hypothetical protein
MGSSSAAFWAGYNPKNTPTSALKTKDSTTETGEMAVGQFMRMESYSEAPMPTRMPITPPRLLSATASMRN